jgi:hypothetical protein
MVLITWVYLLLFIIIQPWSQCSVWLW